MSTNAKRDTAPELALRRELHRRGLRYRVCYPVPGAPRRSIDIAFTKAKLAVFVDGCYWHSCPEHGTQPRANSEWWQKKFGANRARDADTNRLLEEAGWRVLRFWEHESPQAAAYTVEAAIRRAIHDVSGRCRPAPVSLLPVERRSGPLSCSDMFGS